ncbi:MAG: hypothetical protein PUH24_08370 [Prevotellaceae bacterium]|nr:hypothetical protein [Prevotellaceae bacterium]MDY6130968.1 hypothetical protein [Prevotella sp.]
MGNQPNKRANEFDLNDFRIADFNVSIGFKKGQTNGMHLLPSFEPFRMEHNGHELFFQLMVDDQLQPFHKNLLERIGAFDSGNGETIVDRLEDGGYQYIIKNVSGHECCLLQANKDFSNCKCALNGSYTMRCFGLNNALMLIFAFAGCLKQTVLIHASLVRKGEYGYAFIAKSGTGKSTQVSMWLRHIEGCDLMNDDNPIIRVIDDQPYVYGSPWSGKTPCYRVVKAKLGAITRIDRAKMNSIEKLKPVEAFASLLPSCSTMKWDCGIFDAICTMVSRLVELSDIYTLHCLPNEEAAQICCKTIAKDKT